MFIASLATPPCDRYLRKTKLLVLPKLGAAQNDKQSTKYDKTSVRDVAFTNLVKLKTAMDTYNRCPNSLKSSKTPQHSELLTRIH